MTGTGANRRPVRFGGSLSSGSLPFGRSIRQGPQKATNSLWIVALSLFRRLEQLQRPGVRFGDDMSDITSTPKNWNAAAKRIVLPSYRRIFFAPNLGILGMLYYILFGRF